MAQKIKLGNGEIAELTAKFKQSLGTWNIRNAGKPIQIPQVAKFKPNKRPTILFTEDALAIIDELVAQCDKEIAWNGLVKFNRKSLTFTVYDILIFPQVVTGTSVNVDETKYANWIASLSDDEINHMRFHGHSHVNMNVGPSGIDTDYQREMLEMQIKDFYIFMIFNKRGDMYACIYDVEKNIFYDKEDIDIENTRKSSVIYNKAKKMIEDNVSTPAPTYNTNYKNPNYGYESHGYGTYGNPAYMNYWARQQEEKEAFQKRQSINDYVEEVLSK